MWCVHSKVCNHSHLVCSIADLEGLYISDVRVYGQQSAVRSAALNGVMVNFIWNATTDALDVMFEQGMLPLSQPFEIEWH